ncbi:MAG: bifunctional oligoribonuclease/PAP phosphatase NrnA [Nitrospirota bacterium]|nr:bifunctional oligoribonuclease/PAP phosphatase NrnA [Nitrospirota bacterium]
MNPPVREIVRVIRKKHDFLITTHLNPEGDAVGSAVGLALALKKTGKKAVVCMADPVPEVLKFLPGADEVIVGQDNLPSGHTWEALIVVDATSLERTGLFEDGNVPAPFIINIDHHISCAEFGNINWIDPHASAAGELVYELIKAIPVEMDKQIAVNLYTSIITDTGFFRYSNTTPRTHRIAARLLETGFNATRVAEQIYESRSFGTLKLLGEFLSAMEKSGDGRIAWSQITEEMFRRTGATPPDTEGFVNYPRSIRGVDVAMVVREKGATSCSVSLRSKGAVNVATVAERFGGGGHRNAAGCTMEGGIDEIKSKVLGGIAEELGRGDT